MSACSLQNTVFSRLKLLQVSTPTATSTPTASSTATLPPTSSPTVTLIFTPTETPTETLTPTNSPTPTNTNTATSTPTLTPMPTPTPTATQEYVYGIGLFEHAWCNYGPSSAYLFRYDIQKGDYVYIHNRNADASWLWVQPFGTNAYCWTHNTVLDIYGDVNTLYEYYHPLPITTFIGPVEYANAYRNGNEVVLEWPSYYLSEDKNRGWLLELYLCENGIYYWTAIQTDYPTITVIDEPGCSGQSGGTVRIAEKHGYTEPTNIPWPPH